MARPKSEDKKQALLEAATAAFAQSGIAASTALIARNAGVAEGTLFRYFATKDDLLNALYLHLKQDYIKGVLEDYAGTAGSLLTQTSYALEGDVPELATDKFDEDRAPQLTLVVTMGTPGVNFNVDDLFNQILDAYSMNVFAVEAKGAQAEGEPDAVDLQKVYDEVCVKPVDATVNMQTFKAVPGSYGYEFDMVQAQKQISAAQYGEVVRIPMEYVAPEILDDDVFFRDVLGSTSTPHSKNANRTANLELAYNNAHAASKIAVAYSKL